jgi:hypothetical protein
MQRLGTKERLVACSGSVNYMRPARCSCSAECMRLVRWRAGDNAASGPMQRLGTMQRLVQCSGWCHAAAGTTPRVVQCSGRYKLPVCLSDETRGDDTGAGRPCCLSVCLSVSLFACLRDARRRDRCRQALVSVCLSVCLRCFSVSACACSSSASFRRPRTS